MDFGYLGKIDPQKPIRIYGAGISGLVTGYYAQKAGFKIEIHEKTEKSGGLIQVEKLAQGFVDSAAHTILINHDVKELLNELNLKPQYFPEKTKRMLVRSGVNFQSFPISIQEFPKVLAKGMKKIPQSALNTKATVADFFIPWIGKNLVDEIVSTGLLGVYASNAHELHFQSLFIKANEGERYITWLKRLMKNLKSEKKVSASFEKGMGELPHKLTSHLQDHILYNSSPEIDSNFNNIICTNALDAAEILPTFKEELLKIKYKPLLKITFFTKEKIKQVDHAFGALFSQNSSFKTMGLINTSFLFPQRTLEGNLYQYSSLAHSMEDFEHDLNLLGIKKIEAQKVFNWKQGIPLYSYERFSAIETISKKIQNDLNIILFGNYTKDISLRKIITNAKKFWTTF